jgi:hypothetical protein
MSTTTPTATSTFTAHEEAVRTGDADECARLELIAGARIRGQVGATVDRAVFHGCRASRLLRLDDDAAAAHEELTRSREMLAELKAPRRTTLHERLDALGLELLVAVGDWATARTAAQEQLLRAQAARERGADRWRAQLVLARCAHHLGDDALALVHATAAAQGLATHCGGDLDLVDDALGFLETLHHAAGRPDAAAAVAGQRATREATIAAHHAATGNDALVRVLMELDALVGLDELKDAVRTLANFLRVQVLREQGGRPRAQLVQHLVFSGPPGTGKTTVARLMGRIYQAVGVLEKGHVVEVGRADLVAGFAGQTAIKTAQVIDTALDGILFIDEAYSLFEGHNGSAYGPDAVATLIQAMEDHRDRLVVIIAGYPEPLDGLLRSNPGISSRFTTTMAFVPYSATQLAEIFCRLAAADQYDVTAEARAALVGLCGELLATADEHFGNARAIRNAYKDTLQRHADRVIAHDLLHEPALSTLTVQDLARVSHRPR